MLAVHGMGRGTRAIRLRFCGVEMKKKVSIKRTQIAAQYPYRLCSQATAYSPQSVA